MQDYYDANYVANVTYEERYEREEEEVYYDEGTCEED